MSNHILIKLDSLSDASRRTFSEKNDNISSIVRMNIWQHKVMYMIESEIFFVSILVLERECFLSCPFDHSAMNKSTPSMSSVRIGRTFDILLFSILQCFHYCCRENEFAKIDRWVLSKDFIENTRYQFLLLHLNIYSFENNFVQRYKGRSVGKNS